MSLHTCTDNLAGCDHTGLQPRVCISASSASARRGRCAFKPARYVVLNETTLVSAPPLHSCQLRRRMFSLLSQHVCADCRVGCDPFRVEPPPLRYGQQHICTFRLVTLYTCAECRAVYDHAGLYPRTCISVIRASKRSSKIEVGRGIQNIEV